MNNIKSILTLAALAAVAATSVGCYTEHEGHHRRIYEPAGADRHYYYDHGHRYYRGYDDRPGVELHIRP